MIDGPTKICPQCGVAGPVLLARGEVCAACRAQNAWTLRDGEKLVIDRAEIDRALARRAGEAATERRAQRVWAFVPAAAACLLGLVGFVFAWRLSQPREVGPIGELLGWLRLNGMTATLLGLQAVAIGVFALVRIRKTRHFRRKSLLAANALAIVIGTITGGLGGLRWLEGGIGFDMAYTSMPARLAPTLSPDGAEAVVQRIMDATAVVVAPNEDGDGREPALGTGAVIATRGDRAWLVTCSHVAMPYAAVAAWRHASQAKPVWVQFSDGRSVVGRVAWTARPPLDVAVIEATLTDPPAPIPLSGDTAGLDSGAPVMFVPLPYRNGWIVHHGRVQERREHLTPAGPYSLVYTDLPVQPGDSGSGLFDEAGRLVGINTWTRMGDGLPPQGISLPAEAMRSIVDAIAEGRIEQLESLLPARPVQP